MMNKISFYLRSVGVGIALTLAGACTDDFEEVNSDPNSFQVVPPANVMAGVMKNTLDLVGGQMNNWMYLGYGHYAGGLAGNSLHGFGIFQGFVSTYWETFYTDILKETEEIIDLYGDDPQFANRVYTARIWQAYVYSVMVSTWGAVPKSDALNLNTSITYDDEAAIYEDILTTLEEAAQNMTVDGDMLGGDPLYNGNNALWIKFANTLRLKIGLRVSEAYPELAQRHVTAAVGSGNLIDELSEGAALQWGTELANISYMYDRTEVNNIERFMPKVNDQFMMYLTTYRDPRTNAFADPSRAGYVFEDELLPAGGGEEKQAVVYSVFYLGEPLGSASTLPEWNLNPNDNPLMGNRIENYSLFGFEHFRARDMEYVIISASETHFMLAEAALKGWGVSAGQAQGFYEQGIRLSFAKYDLDGADAYLAQDGVRWDSPATEGKLNFVSIVRSSIPADNFGKIVVQRWLAMFHQGHDAWCLQRRTRVLPWAPHLSPAVDAGVDFLEYPERMTYPLTEESLNPVGYAAAVAMQGPDQLLTPLDINREYTPAAWDQLNAEFTTDFTSEFYGPSIDDLIARGMVEVDLTDGVNDEADLEMVRQGLAYDILDN